MNIQNIRFLSGLLGVPLAIFLIMTGIQKRPSEQMYRIALIMAGIATIGFAIANIMDRNGEVVG